MNKIQNKLNNCLFNRIFFIIIITFLLFISPITVQAVSPQWSGNIATSFAGGTGTESDPYLISTGEQLAYFSQQVNNGTDYAGQYIKLTQDILLNNMNPDGTFVSKENKRKQFTSIGKVNRAFRGTFDGNSYEITGLYIDLNWVDYQGLFGYADTGSVIQDVRISGSIAGGNYSGSVAAYTNGIITGCISDCIVTADWRNYHGGIVGYAGIDSVISNCTVLMAVDGKDWVGGIAGYVGNNSIISNCTVLGTVDGTNRVGGIVGYIGAHSIISNSNVSEDVDGTDWVGGIVGYAEDDTVINNCTDSGNVDGSDRVGGIVGFTGAGSLISNCIYSGNVDGSDWVGGMVGFTGADSVISNCTASGTVKGSECVGGVVGYTEGEIIDCSGDNAVTGWKKTGGIAGYASGVNSLISNCTFSATISGTGSYYLGGIAGQTEGLITGCSTISATLISTNSYIGGIAGYAAGVGSKIIDCTVSETDITNHGDAYAGGVAGRTDGEITGCTVNVAVSATNSYIGGVAGYAYGAGSLISECTVSGTVTAESGFGYVGGVVGITDGVITECSSECSVTGLGQHNVGGVAGYAGTESVISICSSSGDVSGIAEIGGVVGYTDGVVTICINTGNVNGSNGHTGGVVGSAGGNSTISNSFNSGAIDGGTGQGGVGGIVGYANPNFEIYHNLSVGTVEGNQLVGGVVGNGNAINDENAWNNYYLDYEGSPDGTNSGDVLNNDGARPIGDMTWEEVYDLLDDDEGEGVWSQDLDDNGIPKPGVFVPSPGVEIINSNIIAGKYYLAADLLGAGTTATITSESVFTVLFSLRYNVSCDPETQTLGLTNNDAEVQLPAGTSVIMLVEDSYYYINLATAVGSIALDEFIKMGSTAEHYDHAVAEAEEEREYLFIFDFSKTAMVSQIAAGSYNIKLLTGNGNSGGTMPVVTVTGKNTYTLTANGGTDVLTLNFSRVSVPGYDYKTDGKVYSYALYLEKDGTALTFPVGTKINDSVIAPGLPYTFAPAAFEDTTSISIDMSNCADPLDDDSYTFQIKVFACSDILNPCNGYLLESGSANVTLTEPVQFAIRASAEIRVFDRSSSTIPVEFQIETLGSENIKATLQRKYGMVYVNMEGQVNQPVTVIGGDTILNIPTACPKGTYRFVFMLYDDNDTERSRTAQSIIIK